MNSKLITHTISGKPMWYSNHTIKKLIVPNIIDITHVKIQVPFYSNYNPYVLYVLYKKMYNDMNYKDIIYPNILDNQNLDSYQKLMMHYSALNFTPIILSYSYPSIEDITQEINTIQLKRNSIDNKNIDTIQNENNEKAL